MQMEKQIEIKQQNKIIKSCSTISNVQHIYYQPKNKRKYQRKALK